MLRTPEWEKSFLKLALLERKEKATAVAETLANLSQPVNLSSLFDEFIDSTKSSLHHHTDSYTHDNGFDKIVLFQDFHTKMKMRLHIWHPLVIPNTKRPRQNVHNHRWNFSSSILTGYADQLLYRFAEPAEEGEEFFHYRYYARKSKEHYEVEERGKTRIICIESKRLNAREIYSVENELLHRVDVPDDTLVATLVITHENVGWVTNDLLSERSIGFNRTTLASPAMTCGDIINKIRSLRMKIGV